MMTPLLFNLWHSTSHLYHRFDLKPNVTNAINGLIEESAEVIAELKKEDNMYHNLELPMEVADCFVVLISGMLAKGLSYSDLEMGIQMVIDKNNKKTSDTHVVHNYKITKKEKLIHLEGDD